MGFVSKLFKGPATPTISAPPPPPSVNDAANAADRRDAGLSEDDETYSNTLLTGAANSTANASTKKNILLGGS